MSLDVYLTEPQPTTVFTANITHNLNEMAQAAGIYMHLWRPEEIGIAKAGELIEPLREGLERLKADPVKFEAYNAPNGWGHYEGLIRFVEEYMEACIAHPEATVEASR